MPEPLPTITRRTAIAMMTAAAAMPSLTRLPDAFDVHAFLLDMDAAGIRVVHQDGWTGFVAKGGGKLRGYGDVHEKWANAIRHCPNYDEQLAKALT